MTSVALPSCAKCKHPFPTDMYNAEDTRACPTCLTPAHVLAFPALNPRPVEVPSPRDESEAGCFFHAGRAAVAPCEQCGRFLCAVCRIDFDGRRICAACIASLLRKHALPHLDSRRTTYDQVALGLAVLGVFFYFVSFLSAPVVLYLCFRHWKTPLSLVHRSAPRFIVAAILASLQLMGWLAFTAFMLLAFLK